MTDGRPTVPDVLPLVREYIRRNEAGGVLHIVLSDGNLDDSSVEYCLNEARKEGDAEAARIAELMLQMTRTQRTRLHKAKWL